LQCIISMVSSTLLTSSASIGRICQIWHNLKPLLFFQTWSSRRCFFCTRL
jgi:hypothetical protein